MGEWIVKRRGPVPVANYPLGPPQYASLLGVNGVSGAGGHPGPGRTQDAAALPNYPLFTIHYPTASPRLHGGRLSVSKGPAAQFPAALPDSRPRLHEGRLCAGNDDVALNPPDNRLPVVLTGQFIVVYIARCLGNRWRVPCGNAPRRAARRSPIPLTMNWAWCTNRSSVGRTSRGIEITHVIRQQKRAWVTQPALGRTASRSFVCQKNGSKQNR